MIEFLPDAEAVHAKLRQMFTPKTRGQRRVIIVAYVGKDAETLLPDFRGVELYCWPQTGATDPYALSDLQDERNGAVVKLVNHLHAKLYWVERYGYVVTSANLSRRALGESIQEEVGLFCDESSAVPIDAILRRLSSRDLEPPELARLKKKHSEFWAKHPHPPKGPMRSAVSFSKSYDSSKKPDWKIAWWDSWQDEAKSTSQRAKDEYGVSEIHGYMDCDKGELQAGDWVLCFLIGEKGTVSNIEWMLVDFVNALSPRERKSMECTHQAVQLRAMTAEHRPPFLLDGAFKRAFRAAARQYGVGRLEELPAMPPPSEFLRVLRKECGKQPSGALKRTD